MIYAEFKVKIGREEGLKLPEDRLIWLNFEETSKWSIMREFLIKFIVKI